MDKISTSLSLSLQFVVQVPVSPCFVVGPKLGFRIGVLEDGQRSEENRQYSTFTLLFCYTDSFLLETFSWEYLPVYRSWKSLH